MVIKAGWRRNRHAQSGRGQQERMKAGFTNCVSAVLPKSLASGTRKDCRSAIWRHIFVCLVATAIDTTAGRKHPESTTLLLATASSSFRTP